MKVYLFYLRKERSLYAHTINRDYAERFTSQRNESLFYLKIVKMDKYEFKTFSYENSLTQLIDFPLEDEEGYYNILGTYKEDELLSYVCEEIERSMDELRQYFERNQDLLSESDLSLIFDLTDIVIQDDTLQVVENALSINTFHLFYYIFRNTFRTKEDEEQNEIDKIIKNVSGI